MKHIKRKIIKTITTIIVVLSQTSFSSSAENYYPYDRMQDLIVYDREMPELTGDNNLQCLTAYLRQ